MVVMDHYMKRAHFAAGQGSDTAHVIAGRLHKEMFPLPDLQILVVSGQDAKFTSTFMEDWPFEVTKFVDRVYYQLRLPPKLGMHPVFHTTLLKSYLTKPYRRKRQRVFRGRQADGTGGG
ncbi:unnamed protein product [Phytophthora fragariaefolia]|uniref:Unnamed protein product n=1 Tax=Phytophthora fragariaefolia TaxID=1490495 RepID=A0A9W7CNM2_9STRA|nr:unnamed protein product [Phytophthora fragariaefolia]